MWITKVLTQKYFIMDKQGNYCFSHEGQKKKTKPKQLSVDIV